ncbi:MAG: EAL domain-containing protein [Thermoanaerobaculia bacterium]
MLKTIFDLSSYEITVAGLPNLVTSIAIMLLGVGVAIRESFSPLARRFLAMNFVTAIWLFSFAWMYWSVTETTAMFWARLSYLGIPFIPCALYSFTLTLYGKLEGRRGFVSLAWSFGVIFSVGFIATDWFISGLYLYSFGFYTRYKPASLLFLAFFAALLVASVRHYTLESHRQPSILERQQSKLLLWAITVGHIGVIDFLPSLGVELYPFGFIGILGYLGIVWFVIARYHLTELTPAFASGEILSTMQGAVIVLDLDERVRFANRAAYDLLHFGPAELTGVPIEKIVGEEWIRRGASPLQRWIFRENAMRWQGRNGLSIAVNVSGSVVRDWDRRPAGIVLTAVDVTDRERAESLLRDSEKRYRELIERTPDLIVILRDERIVFTNPAAVRMLGVHSQADVLGRDLIEFVHPASRGLMRERLNEVAGGSAVERAEEKFQRVDGSLVDADLIAIPHNWEGEKAVLVIARDETARRLAVSELKHSLSLLRSTIESTADGILVVDRIGKVVSYNQRFLQMWRIPPEAVDRGDDDALLESVIDQIVDPAAFLARIGELYRDAKVESLDVIELHDGRIFERFSVPQWLDGLPVGRVWSFRNVTEEKRAEIALRSRDRILEAVAFASEGFLRRVDWRTNIDEVLSRFGTATGVTSVRILEMAGSTRELILRHSWPGAVPEVVGGIEEKPEILVQVARSEIVIDAPEEGEGGDSRVLVPLVPEERVWGVMEWTGRQRAQGWSTAEIEALRAAADALAAAIQREISANALHQSEQRYRLLFERNLAGVYRNTLDGRIIDCNDACARIFGYDRREDLIGTRAEDFYFGSEDRTTMIRELRERRTLANREARLRRRDGTPVWVLESVSYMEGENGEPDYMEGTLVDISDRKEAERQIEYQAYHDALTDLPNRMLFMDRLSVAIAQANRTGRHVAVMFLDLDHFKFINDTLGHSIGDLLLRAIARILGQSLREQDTVARIGGDEFTILLAELGAPGDAATVAQKVLDSIARPIVVEGHELFVTTSIGVALHPADGADAETLLKNADSAMYRAKELGRNNYQLCTPAMNARALARLNVEGQLRRAIEKGELVVHFQPQIRLSTGAPAAVEALVRWQHPEQGLIYPGDFIAIAEESRLIFPIGEFVLREACTQLRRVRAAGFPSLRVAVNLSARQFQQRELVDQLAKVLEETDLDPDALDVEITEGVAMQNTDWALEAIRDLKQLGVGIVLDDFGTGHSSLNYLRRFPIDCLKIDQSFVRELGRKSGDRAIVTAIITMAHGLGLRVVAEGVETEEQRRILAELGCDELQGFLFSPAVSARALLALLPQRGWTLGSGDWSGQIPS